MASPTSPDIPVRAFACAQSFRFAGAWLTLAKYAVSPSVVGFLIIALLVSGCGDDSTPEQQIRTLIGDVETAVEARSAKDAVAFLHDGYRDEWHPDKRAALRSLVGYILRNRSIHLLTVIRDIAVATDELSANAVVYVAMSGVPVQSVEALVSVRADLMRFDIELLSTDDGWRVTKSRWERVELADF